jgi:hypothetical protein
MPKIIVDKIETFTDYEGTTGRRLHAKSDVEFPINTTTIEWMDCPDEVNTEDWFYVEGVGFKKKIKKPYIHPVTGIEYPSDWQEPTS